MLWNGRIWAEMMNKIEVQKLKALHCKSFSLLL